MIATKHTSVRDGRGNRNVGLSTLMGAPLAPLARAVQVALLTLLAACATHAPAGPLASLPTLDDAPRARTAGNWTTIEPGAELDLLNVDGSGRVIRVWMTLTATGDAHPLRSLTFLAWWDGLSEPAVRVPVGDFFGLGHGEPGEVNSLPVVARGTGLSCWWPMPFAEGARIALRNDGPGKIHVYWQVDWEARKKVEPTRFQASWRRSPATVPGEPFVVAEIGGHGRYVGTVLAVDPRSSGWWGEGDDLWYVDGATELSFRGTGTEDFVMQAWGVIPHATAWAGAVDQPGRHVTLYRWFVQDPIPFRTGLVVKMEQAGKPVYQRSDDVSAAAFWYQEPPLTPVPALPPGPERLPSPPKADAWSVPVPPVPVDLRPAANATRFPTAACLPPTPHGIPRAAGRVVLAGVPFDMMAGCNDTPSALLLGSGESATVALPEGGDTLWLHWAINGERGGDALIVAAGGEPRTLRIGTHVDPWNDAWAVPEGRQGLVIDQQMSVRATYVTPVPVGEAREVVLTAGKGATVTVFGVSRGAAPAAPPGGG
ncbi:MAG: glycoside hydrolase family 172 protein [Myxococcota bacterium]